ncbi:GBF-interacting protein 1-like isoform X2 [Impatiens glandulifera]|uniref:GBF-interacting protein 1-like isoform X2 n=1 Tax=Impatiens glandulifera TaxID=253017 RepID=UPI001FB07635|nr:GBF-interacting protein 1-like isoform X2 [Impatiens glandulifera]
MNGGGSTVSITGRVQEMIREIKEITGKHSDDDVYAMLKECNMDPNETTQRLLYLDSFHEVKKKRDRKKTVIIGDRGEQSRSTFVQGQAAKGVRGNYSSYPSRGVAVGRSMPVRKENGISSSVEKKSEISPIVPEKIVQKSPPLEKRSETSPTVPEKIVQNSSPLNMTRSYKMASVGGPWNASNGLVVNEHKRGKSTGIHSTFANDPVPLQNPILHSVVVKDKVNGIMAAAESLTSVVVENGPCSAPVGKVLQATSSNVLPAEVSKPNQQLSGQTTTPTTAVSSKSSTMIVKGTPESVTGQTVSALEMKLAKVNVDPPQPHHVIFPDHIHVPDTVKAGLTFGSLNINYDQTEQVIDGCVGAPKTQLVPETIPEKEDTAKETIMSNEGLSLTAQEGDVLVHSESPRHVVPEVLPLQERVSIDAEAKYDQPTPQEENLLLQGAQNSLPIDPNFSLPSIQVMLSRELHQSEGPETQSGKSQVFEAADSSSLEQQAVDVTTTNTQTSFQVSPPPFPFYAHGAAFPPNYFPYNPYFHPFYVASSMHQFLGPAGFAQLPATGNMYLPSAAVSGVKLETTTTTPQGKPVMNAGKSSTPFVVPSGYGYTTNIPPVVTSGSNNNGTDEYTVSSDSSKESSSIYTTMPQGERPIVYLPASGREMPGFHGHHPFYNGQQIVFAPPPQAGHGLFPGIYPAMQAATAGSNIQQQQFSRYPPSMAGTGETGVLPSPSYQMPTQNGINSNTNYALQ